MTNSPSNSIAQTDKSPKTAIHSLYVLKAICAFIVVMIHIPPLRGREDDSLVTPLVFLGVPVFYMISGYFLYTSDSKVLASRSWRSCIKALVSTLLLNLIYFIPILLKGELPIRSLEDLLMLLAYGQKIDGVLWYMTALFYALLIISCLSYLNLSKYLRYLLVLIPIGTLFGRYAFLLGHETTLYSELNFCLALPYIVLGYILREQEDKILSFKWEIISLIVFLCSCIEVYGLKVYFPGYWGRYVLTPILCTSLFMWCLQYKSWGEGSFLARVGKEYSSNIYYFHMLVSSGIKIIATFLGIHIFYNELGVLYVFAISLVVAMISVGIQKRLGISWLR